MSHEMRLHDVDDFDEGGSPLATRRVKAENHFVDVEIGNRLGRLGMTRTGELAGIEFDERVLRTLSPGAVGPSVAEAFHTAMHEVRRKLRLETRHA